VVHTFHNPGPGEARFLNLHAPGCEFDEYLRSGYEAPFDQEEAPAGSGRPAAEAIVLGPGEGERLRLGDDEVAAPAGSYAIAPPGNVHSFSNPGPDPVRVLNLMAPPDPLGRLAWAAI
jgi:hypothetical protein